MKQLFLLTFGVSFVAPVAFSQNVLVYSQTVADAALTGNSAVSGSQTANVDLGLGPTAGTDDLLEVLSFDSSTAYATVGSYDFFGGFEAGIDTTGGSGFGGTIAIIHRNDGEIRPQAAPPDADLDGDEVAETGTEGYIRGLTYTPTSGLGLVNLDQQTFEYDAGAFSAASVQIHAVVVSGTNTYVSVEAYPSTPLGAPIAADTWTLDATATDWVLWDFTSDDFEFTLHLTIRSASRFVAISSPL